MSGMFSPHNTADQSGNQSIIIEHPVVSNEWIVESILTYPDVTIYAKKIGQRVLNPAQVVTAFWENITPQKIRIKFDNVPCSGFVVLQ